jgi:hypothetical protein
MTENEVAKEIVDVAFKIHSTYGPERTGFLELSTDWLNNV